MMNFRHVASAVCFLLYGLTAWLDSSAAVTYTYTATTFATVKKSSNVRAGNLTWRCAGNRCTITGPWSRPSVNACYALARQVGRIRYYGHPGKRLTSSQLNQCNAGMTKKVAVNATLPIRASVLSRPKYIYLPPAKVSGVKANDKKPAGPDLANKLSLIDVLGNKNIENDLRNFIGWDDKLIGDGALPGKVYYYVPREFLLVHDESGPSLRFTHRRTSGGSGEDSVIMKAKLRAPYRPGDVALLRELAQSAIDRSGRKVIELKPLPIRSMEVVLEVLEKVYRVRGENIFVLAAKDVDGSIDLNVRMSEMNMQEIISQIRHDELTGRVIISTGNGKVEVPFNLGLKRYAGQTVSSVEDIRRGKPLRNMGPFPLTVKGLVTYTKRGQGTTATLHRHYKRLKSGSIAPGRKRNFSLPLFDKLFPGQKIVLAWFDQEFDSACDPCLDAVVKQVSPEPRDISRTDNRESQPVTEPSFSDAPATGPGDVDFGAYYALVIGNNDYRNGEITKLKTAVGDAQAVASLLKEKYEFKEVWLRTDLTRAELVSEFSRLRNKLGPNDNLLIYYAGHGILDERTQRGFWLPVDATPEYNANWYSTADITDTLKAIRAKHVLVVADSCYSGSLTRGVTIVERGEPDYLGKLAEKRARVALTSGGEEPVKDGGGGKHSVFAKAFLDVLRENQGVLDGTDLFAKVRKMVSWNASQTPEYAPIREATHDGGDFLFVPRH